MGDSTTEDADFKTMNEPSSPLSHNPIPGEADPHFGTDEEMLAWCVREKITQVKDRQGNWDWMEAWAVYEARGWLGPNPGG